MLNESGNLIFGPFGISVEQIQIRLRLWCPCVLLPFQPKAVSAPAWKRPKSGKNNVGHQNDDDSIFKFGQKVIVVVVSK